MIKFVRWVLAIMLGVLGLLLHSGGSAFASEPTLPLNLNQICKANQGADAHAVLLIRQDAYSWRCIDGSGQQHSFDLNRDCQTVYGNTSTASLGNRQDAYTWSCSVPVLSAQGAFQYTTFNGKAVTLTPWEGKNVAVLVSPSREADPIVMSAIVAVLDQAYEFYQQTTGRSPTHRKVYNGHLSIAEVGDGETCGAGCGYLGSTGIELTETTFDALYNEVAANNRYSQAVFYELGRNFWFYNDQLNAIPHAFATGFAILNRFQSMDYVNVDGADFRNMSYDEFRSSILYDLYDRYRNDRSLNWQNTLGAQKAPDNPNGWGVTDFGAALMFQVYKDSGYSYDAYTAFWAAIAKQPTATTQQEVIDNFVAAALSATGKDYSYMFSNTD